LVLTSSAQEPGGDIESFRKINWKRLSMTSAKLHAAQSPASQVPKAPAGARPIPFIDLKAQQARIRPLIDAAVQRVLDHGQYILGPEVRELEQALAAFCGVRHAVSCASGTDALILGLLAKGVQPGDAVLVPSFTFAATAEAVALLGATPVFVDIRPDSFNMDPDSLLRGIDLARSLGLTTRGIIPVDLFGQPADYDALEPIARAQGLWLFADAAQSFGALYKGRRVGSIGDLVATSFFPAKPLGCYGDGGAVFTDDDDLADVLLSLRVHGKGTDKYDNVRIGINGRLDTLQAAVLLEKLAIFPEELAARSRIAERYDAALEKLVEVPRLQPDTTSAWAQYTVVLPAGIRDSIAAKLKSSGVPTAVYYPKPLHQQTAYRRYPTVGNRLTVSEELAGRVLSLPMHPYLDEATQERICEALASALCNESV